MTELTEARKDRLDDTDFAYIDASGERKLPIHDESHIRNAIARFNQTDFDDADAKADAARRILRAAEENDIDVSGDDAVTRAADGR